jgi:hypothetical protein
MHSRFLQFHSINLLFLCWRNILNLRSSSSSSSSSSVLFFYISSKPPGTDVWQPHVDAVRPMVAEDAVAGDEVTATAIAKIRKCSAGRKERG